MNSKLDETTMNEDNKTYNKLNDEEQVVDVRGESDESDAEAGNFVSGLYDDEEPEVDKWRRKPVGVVEREPAADVRDPAIVAKVLQESASGAQRLLISGLRRVYTRGRAYVDPVVQQKPITAQRRVELSSYMSAVDCKLEELVARLRQGRVVTRLGAPPGTGKTTRMAAEIATKCGLRVCQLELSAHVAEAASSYQRKMYSVPGSNSRFSRERAPYLTCMTYDDFRGYVCSSSRSRIFADFDVFFFDEAHDSGASVFLALQYFAVYAQAHNSLIVASATVSTDETNNVVSKRVGDFKQVDTTFRPALDSGKLTTEYLRDRSLVLVASDRDVWYARAVYEDQGIDVYTLDSASTSLDIQHVTAALTPEALTPRVLIATYDYGTGYNLPVSYVITSATKLEYDWTDSGAVKEKVVALTERDVIQHKGRTGRAMVVGSGGIVLGMARSAEVPLAHSERVKAYIGLIAASIKPLESQWRDVAKFTPQGLSRDVALRILSVPLPPMLVLRYLGTDGNVAAFFAQAMNMFTQPDHYIVPSKDVYPIGYDKWSEEFYGGYYEGDESVCDFTAKVPFAATPNLKVYMHSLHALACGYIVIDRWRPDSMDDDFSGSENEAPRPKAKARVVMPRSVVDIEKELPGVPYPLDTSWSFDVPLDKQARRKRRVAKDWTTSPSGVAAVEQLKRAVDGVGTVGILMADIATDGTGDKIEVRSPGGSLAVKLVPEMYQRLISGSVILPSEMVSLLVVASERKSRLVESALFCNWGPPWISIFLSAMDESVLAAVIAAGRVDVLIALVKKLYNRFRDEAIEVCKTSNVYSSWFERFVGKQPSLSRLVKEVTRGKLAIAQSDNFLARVLKIKELHDCVLLEFERMGFYAPEQITAAQRKLPIRDGKRRLPVLDDHVSSQPSALFDRPDISRGFARR